MLLQRAESLQAVQPFIQTLLLQAMALYIHDPLRCKNLLGRIPNPHSCHALAAPQPTHPAGGDHAQISSTTPRRSTATERPAPPAHLRSDRPAASRTHAAHTHTAQIRRPAAHAGSCATPVASHDQSPDSTKAHPTIKPDRLFLLHDGTGHHLAAAIRQDATALSKPVAVPGRS